MKAQAAENNNSGKNLKSLKSYENSQNILFAQLFLRLTISALKVTLRLPVSFTG